MPTKFAGKPVQALEPSVETVGKVVGAIPVQLGANFLEHFSEQLYSSPNKAFEELIANAWDAGARTVWITLPDNLSAPDAAVLVLDDGNSMDADGLRDLWQVAYSKKRRLPPVHKRPMIGKFGIGKLATYVLANKLTYFCMSLDGVIRAVTMDYASIKPAADGAPVFIQDLQLELREVELKAVRSFLKATSGGDAVLEVIENGAHAPNRADDWDDEFGGAKPPAPGSSGCWTLVVLSDLKPQGRAVKRGIIRRMIQTALPLGAELNIVLNGELLTSSKLSKTVMKEWIVGHGLGLTTLSLPPEEGADDTEAEQITIKANEKPYPHIVLPGIGAVSGRIRLYEDKLTGGKSEEIGSSNGYYVNVLGRIVNHDPTFGEKDLSHSAWARFRMTVRADGLDDLLAVNREQFAHAKALRVFRAFLRKGFNLARNEYDQFVHAAWEDSGSAIVNAFGTLPLAPVRELISQALSGNSPIADLVDESGVNDRHAALEEWNRDTQADARQVITQVGFEDRPPDSSIAQYRVADRQLVINSNHPFVQEHAATNEQKVVVRNFALLEFLSDVHALEIGVEPSKIEELRTHRDSMARLIAKISRYSGAQIARLLIEVSTYKDPKAFEVIIGDALEYLGLSVTRLATPGEPEGIARAYPSPSLSAAKELYSFTYDAKSSKSGKAKTGDVRVSGLARHRDNYQANHALVVAPEFESGALEQECAANGVTPMRARDMGKLLTYAAEYGAIPLTKFREVFKYSTPDDVGTWVEQLSSWLQKQRVLTFDVFIKALRKVENDIPDTISASLIADYCRKLAKSKEITDFKVTDLARGLQILVPDLIRVEQKSIVISAHPDKLTEAISKQLQILKEATIETE